MLWRHFGVGSKFNCNFEIKNNVKQDQYRKLKE